MQCEACGKQLGSGEMCLHHWFELLDEYDFNKGVTVHYRKVCTSCNARLTRRTIENHGYLCPIPQGTDELPAEIERHLLPEWKAQKAVARGLYNTEPTTERVSVPTLVQSLARLLPPFDSNWSPALQSRWFDTFKALHTVNNPKDGIA